MHYELQLPDQQGHDFLSGLRNNCANRLQATEAQVDLRVVYIGLERSSNRVEDAISARQELSGAHLEPIMSMASAIGPADTGFLRNMSLLGDKNRILQVLMNLVSNSLKFTRPKGAIEVRIRCVGFVPGPLRRTMTQGDRTRRPSVAALNSYVNSPAIQISSSQVPSNELLFNFEVEDTGPGIPEQLRGEIFKPFVQGDVALSKKYGGTGLGLAICTQLATLMSGSIHLKSTVGIGSTFTLSTPLFYTKEQAPSVSNSVNTRSGSKPGSRLTRSLKDESKSLLSARTRDRSPTRLSVYSGHEPQLDVPRIIGYSYPYISDSASLNEDYRPKSPPHRSRAASPLVLSRQVTRDDVRPRRPEQLQLSPTQTDSLLARSDTVEKPISTQPSTPREVVTPSRTELSPVSTNTLGKEKSTTQRKLRVLVAEDNKGELDQT